MFCDDGSLVDAMRANGILYMITQNIREYRRLSPFDPGFWLYNMVTSK